MEGPSLFLAAEQLAPFVGKKIETVEGNTKIEKERLVQQKILSIFSYGKYLFFQFDTFALRVHFLLFGSFEATVENKKVTGDYPKKARTPRLAFKTNSGHIEMYSCSVRFMEESDAKKLCDFSTDTMSEEWDEKKTLKNLRSQAESEIGDVLLDQTLFTGVGNIIRNEVLILAKVLPIRKVNELSLPKLKKIVQLTREYVFNFYEWRKKFELKKHYIVYRQSYCKQCGTNVIRQKTGVRQRISFMCPQCQK
ncbi:MAG: endonuclease [Candidatus Protochlamydia sp.]|nr:endonuclease [Candidatus Protochlamydia sp.]